MRLILPALLLAFSPETIMAERRNLRPADFKPITSLPWKEAMQRSTMSWIAFFGNQVSLFHIRCSASTCARYLSTSSAERVSSVWNLKARRFRTTCGVFPQDLG